MALFWLPAPAEAKPLSSACHTFSSETATFDELVKQPARWNCGLTHWKDPRPVAWLRFDLAEWDDAAPPELLVTRITKFDRIDITVMAADGSRTIRTFASDQVTPLAGRSVFSAPLPAIGAEATTVVVRIERPWNAAVLSDATLTDAAGGVGWPVAKLVVMGMLVGLMFASLIFDGVLYWVLRQRFVLFHAGLVLSVLAYVACFSGLVVVFGNFDVVTLARLNGLAPSFAAGIAGFFTVAFLERGMLSARVRNFLIFASIFALVVPGTVTLHPPFLDPSVHQFYFLGFLPALVAQVAAITQAYRRRSRAAKFLLAAWAPIILCAAERIARGVGLYAAPVWADELIYFALVLEVVVSACGVADRLMAVRRQRDVALRQARVLASLAESDPLTGLLNRRAIEPRFGELCNGGFSTFALLDLDHFKSVNDEYGHDIGDAVLCAVAEGLAPDDDTLVVRLGGEEFLMLLRGEDTKARAEERRRLLPRRIDDHVPGLATPVTASMGLVEGTSATMAAGGFGDVYSRADKLLYEAKLAGRDRMAAEKLTVFPAPSPNDRRQADRRTGDRRMGDRRTSPRDPTD